MSADSDSAIPASRLRRWLILSAVVFPAAIYVGAQTIANAVLPQMQGDLSAGIDQISWVVTASVVAGAIGIPPTGWLAARLGRTRLMVAALIGFSASSIFVGLADSLEAVVLFRILGALFGAPIVALSQAVTLDTFPREEHGVAFAFWSIGILLGWVYAPAIGAYVAELQSWRLIFFCLTPVGLAGALFCSIVPETGKQAARRRFDWSGFIALSLAITGFLVVLNRGQRLDWFHSAEILAWSAVGLVSLYVYVAHTLTTRDPLVNWNIFRDRNYTVGSCITLCYASMSLAPLVLIPTMLVEIKGLELFTTGVALVPRGMAQMVGLLLVGSLVKRYDPRLLVFVGFVVFAYGSLEMANYTREIGWWEISVPNIIQGIAMSLIWVPTVTFTYSQLEPRLRTDGATMVSLVYSLASSIGVAASVTILTRTAQISREELAGFVVPTNELLRFPEYASWDLDELEDLASISGEINQQALMIGYVNVFWASAILSLAAIPLLLLVKIRR